MITELLPLKGNFLAITTDSPCPMTNLAEVVSLSPNALMLDYPDHETSLLAPPAYAG